MKIFYWTNPTGDRHRAQQLRIQLEKELEGLVKFTSPFYNSAGEPNDEIRALDRGKPSPISKYEIKGKDIALITEADGVVAFVTNQTSWGSIQECYESYDVQHKPTYIIFDGRTQGKCKHCNTKNPNDPNHPWALTSCTRAFNSPQSFIDYIKAQHQSLNPVKTKPAKADNFWKRVFNAQDS